MPASPLVRSGAPTAMGGAGLSGAVIGIATHRGVRHRLLTFIQDTEPAPNRGHRCPDRHRPRLIAPHPRRCWRGRLDTDLRRQSGDPCASAPALAVPPEQEVTGSNPVARAQTKGPQTQAFWLPCPRRQLSFRAPAGSGRVPGIEPPAARGLLLATSLPWPASAAAGLVLERAARISARRRRAACSYSSIRGRRRRASSTGRVPAGGRRSGRCGPQRAPGSRTMPFWRPGCRGARPSPGGLRRLAWSR